MNDYEIAQFESFFEEYMRHADEEIDSLQRWEEARHYTEQFYEQKAAELEITVDYYISEFV